MIEFLLLRPPPVNIHLIPFSSLFGESRSRRQDTLRLLFLSLGGAPIEFKLPSLIATLKEFRSSIKRDPLRNWRNFLGGPSAISISQGFIQRKVKEQEEVSSGCSRFYQLLLFCLFPFLPRLSCNSLFPRNCPSAMKKMMPVIVIAEDRKGARDTNCDKKWIFDWEIKETN